MANRLLNTIEKTFGSFSTILFYSIIAAFFLSILTFIAKYLNTVYHIRGKRHGGVIKDLYIYPIKSCAGIRVERLSIDETGPKNDREYVIVEENGTFMTQRKYPKMSLIQPDISKVFLKLTAPKQQPIVVKPLEGEQKKISVRVWDCVCEGIDQGDEVGEWLSSFLGQKCRLIKMVKDFVRPTVDSILKDVDFTDKFRAIQSRIKFTDESQFLLTTEESLKELNSRMKKPILMNRFRPTIVVDGAFRAFEEDSWNCLDINGQIFTINADCFRCKLPTVIQELGEVSKDGEPSKTLESFRKKAGGVAFGRYMMSEFPGEICVGDHVHSLGLLSFAYYNLKRYRMIYYLIKDKIKKYQRSR